MNEYLLLGIVGVVMLVVGMGASWVGKIVSGKPKTTDKT